MLPTLNTINAAQGDEQSRALFRAGSRKGSLGTSDRSLAPKNDTRIRQSVQLSHGGGFVYTVGGGDGTSSSIVGGNHDSSDNTNRMSIKSSSKESQSPVPSRRKLTGIQSLRNWKKGVTGRLRMSASVKFLNEDEEMQYTANSVYSALSNSKQGDEDRGGTSAINSYGSSASSTLGASNNSKSSQSSIPSSHLPLILQSDKVDVADRHAKYPIPPSQASNFGSHRDNKMKVNINGRSMGSGSCNDNRDGYNSGRSEEMVSLAKFPIPTILEDQSTKEENFNLDLEGNIEENSGNGDGPDTIVGDDFLPSPKDDTHVGNECLPSPKESALSPGMDKFKAGWNFDTKRSTSRKRIRDRQRMFLCLEIEKCEDLRRDSPVSMRAFRRSTFQGRGSDGYMNPFVLIRLNDNEVGRTPALKNTRSPIWFDELFRFPICTDCKKISFEVWNMKSYSHDLGDCIGVASIDMRDLIHIHEGVEDEFLEYDLEVYRFKDDNKIDSGGESDDVDRNCHEKLCSCPRLDIEENIQDVEDRHKSMNSEGSKIDDDCSSDNIFRTFGKVASRNVVKSWRKLKQLGQSSTSQNILNDENNQSYKIENPFPYRRQDIREDTSKKNDGSCLTSSSMKALAMILGYLTLGILGFSVLFEKKTPREALYLGIVTFTTVGYGDVVPKTKEAKIFTCFFAFTGIGIIGIALGYIGQHLVQAQVAAMQKKAQETYDDSSSDSSEISTSPPRPIKNKRFVETLKTTLVNFFVTIGPVTIMVAVGAAIVGYLEEWDPIDSIYWCVMTGTSVGYGDFYPTKPSSMWFAIIFIPISVGVISHTLGKIANTFVEREIAKANSRLLKREVTLEDLEAMNADGDGEVSPLEFIEHMLLTMNKVDRKLLNELHAQFDRLDADDSGGLQEDDLAILTERKLKERRQRALVKYNESLLSRGKGFAASAPQIVPSG